MPRSFGGVAVPDIFKYYREVHLGRVVDWCRHTELKLWIGMEQQQSPVPLRRAPWCYAALPISLKTHSTIGPMLQIGARTCRDSKYFSKQSPLFPILGNPSFLPGTEAGITLPILRDMAHNGFSDTIEYK